MKGNHKHGLSHTPIYRRWASMVGRCKWKSHTSWKWYGAVGIRVCERWLKFDNFLADMGVPPFPNATIERRKATENYSLDNCYWATPKQQARNRNNNLRLTLNGRTQCAAEWAEELRVPQQRIESRKARGWDDVRTLTELPRKTSHTIITTI